MVLVITNLHVYTLNFQNMVRTSFPSSMLISWGKFLILFVILNVRTKVPKLLNNRKFVYWWQTFTAYRPTSSGLKENVLIFDFIWKIIILYKIIVSLEFEVLMFFTSIDNIYFILILLYFFLTFILILFWNLIRHRCFSVEVNYY